MEGFLVLTDGWVFDRTRQTPLGCGPDITYLFSILAIY